MLKFLKCLIVWFVILLVFASVAGYVYIRLEGKHFFEKKLASFFDQPATIEEVRYLVPFGVRFHRVDVKNILEAEDVFLHLKIPFFLKKRFIIGKLELISPVFHLVRPEQKEIDFGGAYLSKQERRFQPEERKVPRRIEGVIVDFLSVFNGRAEILDLAVDEPVKYDIQGLNFKALKASYPLKEQNIKFDIEGEIVDAGQESWLKGSFFAASGWINWLIRSMSSSVTFESGSGVMGRLELEGRENLLKVKGRASLVPVDEGVKEGEDEAQQASVLFDTIQGSRAEIMLNFNFETEMDSFAVDMIDFDGEIELLEEKTPLEKLNPSVLFGLAQEKRSGN